TPGEESTPRHCDVPYPFCYFAFSVISFALALLRSVSAFAFPLVRSISALILLPFASSTIPFDWPLTSSVVAFTSPFAFSIAAALSPANEAVANPNTPLKPTAIPINRMFMTQPPSLHVSLIFQPIVRNSGQYLQYLQTES